MVDIKIKGGIKMELQANYRENNVNELIKTQQNESGEVIVSGRELHEFLEVATTYKKWMDRMIEYGFTENVDFAVLSKNVQDDTAYGGYRKIIDHALKVDMAKEISMLQRSDKGKQARQYFIQLEKMWNSPEMVMQRALEFSRKQVEELKRKTFSLEAKVEEQKPKVLLAESIENSNDLILVKDLANILKQNGYDIGQNRLFERLRDLGYLIKTGTARNTPTQRSMELGLFRVVEGTVTTSTDVKLTRTTKVTTKGQRYFVNKFLSK